MPPLLSLGGDPPSAATEPLSVEKAVAAVTDMTELGKAFTSCSCSHPRPGTNGSTSAASAAAQPPPAMPPLTALTHPPRGPPVVKNEHASALQPTIKVAQTVHARNQQCREWANVVAVAARDAEHTDVGLGGSNPYSRSKAPTDQLSGGTMSRSSSSGGRAQPPSSSAPGAAPPGRLYDIHGLNSLTGGDSHSGHSLAPSAPAPVPAPASSSSAPPAFNVDEAYPPTAPAKWYEDPVADARSRPHSRANTPPRGASGAPSASASTSASASASISMSLSASTGANGCGGGLTPGHSGAGAGAGAGRRRPSASALTPISREGSDLKRAASDDGDGDGDSRPRSPKRRSAPASPARPRSMLLLSPCTSPALSPRTSPEVRARPLLAGTIASRTGPALAQVRAAFASVGIECTPAQPTKSAPATVAGMTAAASPQAQVQGPPAH